MAKRKPNRLVLVLILIAHVLITTATWRDINRRSPSELRGSKSFWRTASALNTTGSLSYLLIGRKSG